MDSRQNTQFCGVVTVNDVFDRTIDEVSDCNQEKLTFVSLSDWGKERDKKGKAEKKTAGVTDRT
jgi:hypothetical protein